MPILERDLESLEIRLAKNAALAGRLDDLKAFLIDSEQLVIELINHLYCKYEQQRCDVPPLSPAVKKRGELEFGLILYWIDCPPRELLRLLDEHKLLRWAWDVLQRIAPRTRIATADYDFLIGKAKSPGVSAEDGTLYGFAPYEQLDYRWIYAGLNYLLNLAYPESLHPFGTNPFVGELAGGSGTARIAVVGDWGTGDETAEQVLSQAMSLKPDCVIHLGDVYYAGTELRPPPGEETANFVALWQKLAGGVPSFTLNSNHEMYSDGSGYFDVALGAPPFAQQQGTSYFCLYNDDWVILGLDSAYYSQSALYMQGNLSDPDDPATRHQQQFIADLEDKGILGSRRRIIVLTHHTGSDYSGARPEVLIDELYEALGRNPDYWYWGHIHNGFVYSPQSYMGKPALGLPFAARCVGHSAIPFGNAWGLEEPAVKGNVDYYAHTPVHEGSVRVRNGFALITLTADRIGEQFYEACDDGRPQLVWSS